MFTVIFASATCICTYIKYVCTYDYVCIHTHTHAYIIVVMYVPEFPVALTFCLVQQMLCFAISGDLFGIKSFQGY